MTNETPEPGAVQNSAAGAVADPGPVLIRPRDVRFDCRGIPLHWIPGHPVASNLISTLNLMLPEGERWFVQTFEEALEYVADEELRDTMRGFIGQEAIHSEMHDDVLWGFLHENGVDATAFQRQLEWVFGVVLGPRPGLSRRRRRQRLVARLWVIAAVEHFTAVFGDFALNNEWDAAGAAPELCDLYRWHGAEEVEHRAVAHDVAAYFGDSFRRRVLATVVAFPLLVSLILRGAHFINHHDPAGPVSEWTLWRRAIDDSRRGLLPRGRDLLRSMLRYYRRGYRPEGIGSTAQAVAYLAGSPGTRAAQ